MAKKMSEVDFADKVEWEGGLIEATFSYGLSSDSLENTDTELYQAMVEYDKWFAAGREIIERVEDALDNIE